MKQERCPYCMEKEFLDSFGYKAFETETSKIIVFKDQSKKGRVVVSYKKDHVAEIIDLTDEERNKFIQDVSDVAKTIKKLFNSDRINYGAFGDTLGHLHFHLVPKYKNGAEWGGMFTMNTGSYSKDEELEQIANLIKTNFRK